MLRGLCLPLNLLLLLLWLRVSVSALGQDSAAKNPLWLESADHCGAVQLSVSFRGIVDCLYECAVLNWCACARLAGSECHLMAPGGDSAAPAATAPAYRKVGFPTSGPRQLQLAECQQSSVYSSGNLCGKAADANLSQSFSSCFCTASGANQWWEAGTAADAFITQVALYNRGDCCPDRLNSFVISVDGVACVDFITSTAFSVRNFTCNRRGRRLRVTSRLTAHLTICEVVAFGFM